MTGLRRPLLGPSKPSAHAGIDSGSRKHTRWLRRLYTPKEKEARRARSTRVRRQGVGVDGRAASDTRAFGRAGLCVHARRTLRASTLAVVRVRARARRRPRTRRLLSEAVQQAFLLNGSNGGYAASGNEVGAFEFRYSTSDHWAEGEFPKENLLRRTAAT